MANVGWQFWIDRGGTFTDVVALDPAGELETLKILSQRSDQYDDAATEAIARLIGHDRRIDSIRIGTTVATNALLERRGARTALVTTAGFGDLLRIGTQQRPDIFALEIKRPDELYELVIEANERIAADGEVLTELDIEPLRKLLAAAKENGIDSVAIAFMHAYAYPAHERRAAQLARELGFIEVAASHEVAPLIKLVERGRTTVVEAYLNPVLRAYVDGLKAGLANQQESPELLFMQSHGGLIAADRFRGLHSILSGPAGGVVGMAGSAKRIGIDRVIGFDMGGTSTDVSVYSGEFERDLSTMIGGTPINAPMMRINTVAAGGGSILSYEGGRLRVGPGSAGADPGPACYRNGGPATLTDANLILGRLLPEFFPAVFGPDGDRSLDRAAAETALDKLAQSVDTAEKGHFDAESVATGCLRIAIEHMASAIEQVSVQRGHDVTRFVLSAFGGAGGQHACRVADALGIEQVIIDPLAGLLSAYGIGIAELRSIRRQTIDRELTAPVLAQVVTAARSLERELGTEFERRDSDRLHFEWRLGVRTRGSDTPLDLPLEAGAEVAELDAEFATLHRQRFGFEPPSEDYVVDSIEVEAVSARMPPRLESQATRRRGAGPVAHESVWFDGGRRTTPIYRRDELGTEDRVCGPAIVIEATTTTVVEPGWVARLDPSGILVLDRRSDGSSRNSESVERDPVRLEIFNNQFMHIAEQMGNVLQQTAFSVNIKERLDFSCALFDGQGALIANAPHVPVHLGSMGDSVLAVLEDSDDIRPGDSFMLNAPYRGGTHLPDITVVTPLFDGNGRIDYIVASRAHHADIGGITPGSMPAASRHIDEEGISFASTPIVRGSRFLETEVRQLLESGPYPARNPDQNIADLKAQLAANARGAKELARRLGDYGPEVVAAYAEHVRRNAEECMRHAIRSQHGGQWRLELDGGETIAVNVAIDHANSEAEIDFAGTGPASETNFNAPLAVTRAVVLYVFRTLIAEDIPLNSGCLAPLKLRVPAGSLLDPHPPAAVVAGNVETSQCVADALFAALGVLAASQGTMNNLTFGNDRYQYYETLCGGTGAGRGFDGADAVHSHMTNSRLTDVEVLEHRFPVRVCRFAIRRGSGGGGRWRGGDGVAREIEFLEAMQASILSNRRRTQAFGLDGGAHGKEGRNSVLRASGTRERLAATAAIDLEPGDRILIETPGGGGFGRA